MEFKLKSTFPLILGILLCLPACDKMDMPGMFIETESANFRFQQSDNWNKQHSFTEINVPADNYILNVAADIHIGGTNNFDRFLDDSKKLKAAAVIFNGDICTGNTADYKTVQQHLPDENELKYFSIAGNHDLFFDGWKEFYQLFGSSSYYFTVKSAENQDLFICIDTGNGTLGIKQLYWLEKILKETLLTDKKLI